MATPAQLVETVNSATGVPLPTVVDIDRKLVKAKLRTKTGRGLHAARMTPLDAARLLAGVLGSPQANTAADAVERYSRTAPDRARSSDKLFATAKLHDLGALPARHSFIEALAALIASAATGSLARMMAASKEDWSPSIEVFAFTRATRGRIRIAGLPNALTVYVEYGPAAPGTHPAGKIDRRRKALADDSIGDLEQSRRITERTILAIATLLSKDDRHERNDGDGILERPFTRRRRDRGIPIR
jgi:hypothetical protein